MVRKVIMDRKVNLKRISKDDLTNEEAPSESTVSSDSEIYCYSCAQGGGGKHLYQCSLLRHWDP
jgi:hypothetical protein